MNTNNSDDRKQKLIEAIKEYEKILHSNSAFSVMNAHEANPVPNHINSAYALYLYEQGKIPDHIPNVNSVKALENYHKDSDMQLNFSSVHAYENYLQKTDLERLEHNLLKYISSAKQMDEIHTTLFITYDKINHYYFQKELNNEDIINQIQETYISIDKFFIYETGNNSVSSSKIDIKEYYELALDKIVAIKTYIKNSDAAKKQILNILSVIEVMEYSASTDELKDLLFGIRMFLIILINNL